MATIAELGLRAGRCARRYQERGQERLTAQLRLMPRLEDLLQPQRQKTDDLADRLRRALSHRLSDARHALADTSGALRTALLPQRFGGETERLDAVRLRPDLLPRRLTDTRVPLDRRARLPRSTQE